MGNGSRYVAPYSTAFDTTGIVSPAAKLNFYVTGTDTRLDTYSDYNLTIPNSNPVQANGAGLFPSIFLKTAAYKVVLTTSDDDEIWTADPVYGIGVLSQSVGYNFVTTADLLAGFPGSVTLGDGTVAQTVGRTSETDGGGGLFYYNASDTTTADNGGTIRVDGANRRWVWIGHSPFPELFGAVGGGTDDTTAITKLLNAVMVSGAPIDAFGKTYVVQYGILPTITTSYFTMFNFNLKAKGGTTGTALLQVTGSYFTAVNCIFDGNQAGMSNSAQGGSGLMLGGAFPTLRSVQAINCVIYGVTTVYNAAYGIIMDDCRFCDNASSGLQLNGVNAAISSTQGAPFACEISNSQIDRNGWGFQKVPSYPTNYANNDFLGFAMAIRFRSNHITFTNCSFDNNGRDGANVNQGSYAIKFVGCQCIQNGDGGFTLANDNQSTGHPGEGESPYNIEYSACRAQNNYSSGLAAYCAVYDIKVMGGDYYNNNRQAGNLAFQTSFQNGIYFAAESINCVVIGANCYDDRCQAVVSTIVGNPTFTVTNWQVGNLNYYDNVAIYDSTYTTFRGYATVTAEVTSPSVAVTLAPTAHNGATLAAIQIGDIITPAVQHCGVFYDNTSTGLVRDVRGYGMHIGPLGTLASGDLVISGVTENGTTGVKVVGENLQGTLLTNGTFDAGVVTGWTYNLPGGGAANAVTGTTTSKSPGGLQIVAGAGDAAGDGDLITNGLEAALGSHVRLGAWVKATSAAQIILFFGITPNQVSATHPGDGLWHWLEVWVYVPILATTWTLFPRVTAPATTTCYFDSLVLDTWNCLQDIPTPSRNLPY